MYNIRMEPYEGTEAYIFISYAHANASQVWPIIDTLHDRGYRIWYDDGIDAGAEWPAYIEDHLNRCAAVIAFITADSVASANCRKEITYALSKGKPFIYVMLEKTELAQGMSLQLADQYCVNRGSMSEEKFLRKLSESGALEKCKRSRDEIPSGRVPEAQTPPAQKKGRPVGLIVAAPAVLLLLLAVFLFLRKPEALPEQQEGAQTSDPSAQISAAEPAAPEEVPVSADTAVSAAYVYYDDSGLPKYWLDFTGSFADDPVLHCYFFTDSWYESCYILDYSQAASNSHQDTYRIETVKDAKGFDISGWFKTLSLVLHDDSARLYIERNPATLAGGPNSTILDGLYEMTPADAGVVYELIEDGTLKSWLVLNSGNAELHFGDGRTWHLEVEDSGDDTMNVTKIVTAAGEEVPFRSFTVSLVQGSMLLRANVDESFSGSFLYNPRVFLRRDTCSAEELGRMAQMYYYRHHDFYPPCADVVPNEDGTSSVHLYETVDNGDGTVHTATSAWYTVDGSGIGADDISGERIDLRM